jgi:hypothetical protein
MGINVNPGILSGCGRYEYLPINGRRQHIAGIIIGMLPDQIDTARRLKKAWCHIGGEYIMKGIKGL